MPQPKGFIVSPLPPHLMKIMAQKTHIGEGKFEFFKPSQLRIKTICASSIEFV